MLDHWHTGPGARPAGRDVGPLPSVGPSLHLSRVSLLCPGEPSRCTRLFVLGGNPAGGPRSSLGPGWVASSQSSSLLLQGPEFEPCVREHCRRSPRAQPQRVRPERGPSGTERPPPLHLGLGKLRPSEARDFPGPTESLSGVRAPRLSDALLQTIAPLVPQHLPWPGSSGVRGTPGPWEPGASA